MNVTRAALPVMRKQRSAGADAVQTFEAKANTLLIQARAHHEWSASLAYEDT
jgi:uroporphyrinogen-III decarboxylase